ncbi:MAG TPA: glycoside hydrolase family 88 protein [Bryobacteraceae bacterium]|jgi:rhamnogalacturonyl hydrolase YesR|nr:glycoside hydrolase family 88 protein [Bryobacteraceae bacterium]
MFYRAGLLALLGASVLAVSAPAQSSSELEKNKGVGDSPDTAPPLASGLRPGLNHADVRAAMRKVADWQLERARPYFSTDWTFAALYDGFMAASSTLGDAKYEQAMRAMGDRLNWQLGKRPEHADDVAVGQVYLELYLKKKDPRILPPLVERFSDQMGLKDDPAKPLWWWCDALFMGPPTLARLYKATGKTEYLDFMNREWWITSHLLYDPEEHLYFRDAGYLARHEANGRKLFWSRGNGWVMAGIARVLDYMPANYPARGQYVQQFREMAAAVIKVQGDDGLWRSGLLDAQSYPLPEVSGSAFIAYALAWGVNRGILDRATYGPAAQKAWAGLLTHVYQDGRLGCIQPVGAAPGQFQATSSFVYGVGAFLLAGSQMDRLHF